MKKYPAACIVVAGFCLAAAVHGDEPQGPAKDIPELDVLKHWIGVWDVEMNVKPRGELPKGMHAKGTTTAEWVLGGRFVQQTGTLKSDDGSPPMHATTLMTYDPGKKVYRSWMFFSSGAVSESEGKWDEKSRTMTSTSRDADSGGTMTIHATFPEDGVENWRIVEKDREGKVVGETSGKNVRRKK
jgi:hypothetical protein